MSQNFRSEILPAQTPGDVQLPTQTLSLEIIYSQNFVSFFLFLNVSFEQIVYAVLRTAQ